MASGTLTKNTEPAQGLLSDPEALPLLPSTAVRVWGTTLVVAPHPDDDTLGCGGAIALLRRAGLPVHVLFVSDGAASHPNSRRFPPPAVRDLREAEAHASLARLGLSPYSAMFLRLPDGALPGPEADGFGEAVRLCGACLAAVRPDTLLLPWRRDPHPDHRATIRIVRAALDAQGTAPRLLEYPIWAWERAAPDDLPRPQEARAFRLDIAEVAALKRRAILAHRSQVTRLIDDDPQGCLLSPEMLARFALPWEVFLEVIAW